MLTIVNDAVIAVVMLHSLLEQLLISTLLGILYAKPFNFKCVCICVCGCVRGYVCAADWEVLVQ